MLKQVYATAFGGVVGLEYRQQRPAFKVEIDLRDGIQTAFAVSPGMRKALNDFQFLRKFSLTKISIKNFHRDVT